MVNFCELIGSPVFDNKGKQLGKLNDLIFLDGRRYAEITHLTYLDKNGVEKKISWILVKQMLEEKNKAGITRVNILLDMSKRSITPYFPTKKDHRVSSIVDKEVIDIKGRKLIRVNDVILGKIQGKFYIVGVDIGLESFVRRLGLGWLFKLLRHKPKQKIIHWKSIAHLNPNMSELHTSIHKTKIANLKPEALADIIEDLSHDQRKLMFDTIEHDKLVKTLHHAKHHVRYHGLSFLKIERIVHHLENIPPSHAADIISLMEKRNIERLFKFMSKERVASIKKLLNKPAHKKFHPDFLKKKK